MQAGPQKQAGFLSSQSSAYSGGTGDERHGGDMPLDALDQKTLSSLPALSEIYDAYGVQVNALSLNEIFALYERAGFLYPAKAARLFPHLPQVRENWRRMLSAGESLLYVLTSGDEKRGRASLAVWRTTQNGWMSQHLVSENNPYASRAVMLAAAAASIRKGCDLSAQNWFRPENRFPARVFGSMVQTIGERLSSVQRHAYFALPRTLSLPTQKRIRVVRYDASHKQALLEIASAARGSLCHGGRAAARRRIQCCRRTVSQRRAATHTPRLAGLSGKQRRTDRGSNGLSRSTRRQFQLSGEPLRLASAPDSSGIRSFRS